MRLPRPSRRTNPSGPANRTTTQHGTPEISRSGHPEAVDNTLERTLDTRSLLAINLIDMVGVGPFITLPLIIAAMGGPQAILGWILGALLSLADGCIWCELGTAYPEAGGSYAYLQHLYPARIGRALAFLYAWQLLLSAPLSIASGCIGFAQYAASLLPYSLLTHLPAPHRLTLGHFPIVFSIETVLAMLVCLVASALLHRRISSLETVVRSLGLAVIGAIVWIIVTGFTHFHPALAFSFPPGAFHLDSHFLYGLGAGMLISAYDYWGYYNACFLGAEVRNPRRALPRAVLGSIVIVAILYLLMNVSVLGVVPWQHFAAPAGREVAMAAVMRAAYPGPHGIVAAHVIVALIAVAASASVLALLLGYSRIPYAAARDGNFPVPFGHLSPRTNIPTTSLRTLTVMALFCCLFRLQEVISTLVVLRILFQFLLQGTGVLLPAHRRARNLAHRLRTAEPQHSRTDSHPSSPHSSTTYPAARAADTYDADTHDTDTPAPFRMWLYPLPVLAALAGFTFILLSRPRLGLEIRPAIIVLVAGMAVYAMREAKRGTSSPPASSKGTSI